MGIEQDRAAFWKKFQNNELNIRSSSSAGVNLGNTLATSRRAPLRLVPKPSPKDASPDLIALTNAVAAWARKSTNQDLKRASDIVRNKLNVARLFFGWLDKDFLAVNSKDVDDWIGWLAIERKLKPRTICSYCSHLSSFFKWLLKMPEQLGLPPLRDFLKGNPVTPVFPTSPKPYQSARSLSDDSLRALDEVFRSARRRGRPADLRDYAIYRLFAATGDRRAEILSIRGSDIELLPKTGLIYFSRKKGGDCVGKTILDPEVRKALLDYLKRSERRAADVIGRDVPLWLAHANRGAFRSDRADNGMTSRAFADRLRRFGEKAGIYNLTPHQLRHSWARLLAEKSQSLAVVQEGLGHKNPRTTEIYVGRIIIKADLHSRIWMDRVRRRR